MPFIADEIQEKPMSIMRRIGKFSVSSDLIHRHPDAVMKGLADCLIVRAELHWDGYINYTALCAEFDEVPSNELTPTYSAAFLVNSDGSLTRTWSKQGIRE